MQKFKIIENKNIIWNKRNKIENMNWAFWISTPVIKRYWVLMGQYDGPNKAHFVILN